MQLLNENRAGFHTHYDTLNRLEGSIGNQSGNPYTNYCWSYDPFGNRTNEAGSTEAFQSGSGGASPCQPQTGAGLTNTWASYNPNNNQISGTALMPNGDQYDLAGDVSNDGANQYLYDGDGRLCAVRSLTTGGMTEYIYDAEGQRVMKGTISTFNCNPASNGFSVTTLYTRGLNGEDLTESAESNGSYQWDHTNVFASGELLATYKGTETYFALNDWLGTKRAEATPDGSLATYSSLPWGNGLTVSGTIPDATAQHFTGKERDTESGNDYFGARYYASTMGRWMSPDPSGLVYADPKNPQSLNLYAYVLNNPLVHIDPRGLDCVYFNDAGSGVESVDHNSNSGECGQNGGDWVNGTTYSNLASYNSKSDTWNIASWGNEGGTLSVYWTTAYAPGPGGGGTDQNGSAIPCSGNCDTANGYSSTGYAFFGGQIANGNWYDALHWAVGQTWQVNKFQKWIINDPNGRNWCGAGGTGAPSGSDDWACMAHDYNYMSTGNTWPGDNLVPFSGNKQLQDINQTLCNNVSSSNIKNFFTYGSFAGCN